LRSRNNTRSLSQSRIIDVNILHEASADAVGGWVGQPTLKL
jgi:hypothetical protein